MIMWQIREWCCWCEQMKKRAMFEYLKNEWAELITIRDLPHWMRQIYVNDDINGDDSDRADIDGDDGDVSGGVIEAC